MRPVRCPRKRRFQLSYGRDRILSLVGNGHKRIATKAVRSFEIHAAAFGWRGL
jgi:hypothetical protein